jgi:hypothetical protein
VQFHPSYTYEDFFEGSRPEAGGSGTLTFAPRPGPFRRFVEAAEDNKSTGDQGRPGDRQHGCLRPLELPALHLGDIFDAILDSASLRVLKGDLAGGHSPFFGPWLSDHRMAPAEAVLVDDSPPASAVAIGLQTRLVEYPGKVGAS